MTKTKTLVDRSPRNTKTQLGVRGGTMTTYSAARALPLGITAACLALCACGGGSAATGGRNGARAAADTAGPSWSQRSVAAYLEGDLARASTASASALQLDAADAHALEVAARVALARLDGARAIVVLTDARSPVLVRLRARAHVTQGNLAAALADVESVDGQEPADGWAVAMLPVLRAAAGRPGYVLSGAAESTLAYAARAPDALTTVSIEIDGRAVNALVSTAAGAMVVDDSVSRTGTLLARVALGALIVENVPALSRDLADVSTAAGVEIGAVIGADLLVRLHATLDGPGRSVTFRAAAAPLPTTGAQRLDLFAFEGTLLAVRASINDSRPAFFALDNSAALPVALTMRAVRAAGVDAADLETPPGAPPGVQLYTVPALHLGSTVVEQVPAVVGIVPEDLARIAGTRIDGMLGLFVLGQLVVTFDPEGKSVVLSQPAPPAAAAPVSAR